MAHRRGGANRFVRSLRVFLLFERVGSFRKIILPVLLADVFAYFSDRLGSDAGRVGTHISNEADGSFFAELDAFVQALRDHHGALHTETQLARSVLLQLAGGERRRGIATALLVINAPHYPIGFFQRDADLFRFLAVANLDLFFTFSNESRVESRRLAGGEVGINGPVFLLLEGLDLALTFDD